MDRLRNPWVALPTKAPFVLEADRPAIDRYNRTARPDRYVQTSLMPEPFVGRVNAPILLLLLNPGLSDDDFGLHARADFRDGVRRCLHQERTSYANYFLEPNAVGAGARWTRRVLSRLLEEFGAQTVANRVGQLEYFPYHSRRFAHRGLCVPSQEFTFQLLRLAIRREAVILLIRGQKIWEDAVPELRRYKRVYRTNSRQNAAISPRNCPDGYRAAAVMLRATENVREP